MAPCPSKIPPVVGDFFPPFLVDLAAAFVWSFGRSRLLIGFCSGYIVALVLNTLFVMYVL